MLIYLVLPLAIFYFLFLSRVIIVRTDGWLNKEMFVSRNNITLGLWFFILLGLAVFRGERVGTDYLMYYNIFLTKNYSEMEPGINYIYSLGTQYNYFYVFSFIIYLLFLFFIFKAIKKNTPNYLISISIFILTYIYFTGYNQLRQMIAVSLILCFVNYLISEKKIDRVKFCLVILIALLFHNSAIFMFIIFFIPKKKFPGKLVILLFLLTIVLYFMPSFKNLVGEQIIRFSGFYADKYTSNLNYFFEVNKEKGIAQLVPVIIQMFIVTLSLYFPKEQLNLKIDFNLYHFSINIAVLNLCLYSLAGIEAIDRIQVYFSCFNIYFYSFLIHLLLNHKGESLPKNIFLVFVVLFWVSYYIWRLIGNVQGVVPYNLFTS